MPVTPTTATVIVSLLAHSTACTTQIIIVCLISTLMIMILMLNVQVDSGNPDAKRLYDDLMSNYNRLIRPVKDHGDKVTVKLGVRLTQIIEIVRS